jgi:hypothetical protein
MGLNKYYIPQPDKLVEQLSTQGFDWLVQKKFDVSMGHPVSSDIVRIVRKGRASGIPDSEIFEKINQKMLSYNAKPYSV